MIECDVLVIGGGAAGVRAAIAALEQGSGTALISKGPVGRSGATPTAGGGFQLPFPDRDPRNNASQYYLDTLEGGIGIADAPLVRIIAEGARDRILELGEYGIALKKEGEDLHIIHDPGQTYPRSLKIPSVRGFMAGMLKRAREEEKLILLEDVMALELIKDGDAVTGAIAWDVGQGKLLSIRSKATILATGGYQQIFPLASAPMDTAGDGHALAFRAGAELIDLEMVQFYPTAVASPSSARGVLLYYERLCNPRYVAGSLVDETGQVVMPPMTPPPTRDGASAMILKARRAGRRVMLDLGSSGLSTGELRERLMEYNPHQHSHLRALGIDLAQQPVEIAPAAHFVVGGVRINACCETNVPGLYAAGEVSGGVHGANRVSSNALTDCIVFGEVAGRAAGQAARGARRGGGNFDTTTWQEKIAGILARKAGQRPHELRRKLHEITELSLVGDRQEERLKWGLKQLDELGGMETRCASKELKYNKELLNALEWDPMLRCARLVIEAARMRKESRGVHQREDYPEKDDANWQVHTALRQSGDAIKAYVLPVFVEAHIRS